MRIQDAPRVRKQATADASAAPSPSTAALTEGTARSGESGGASRPSGSDAFRPGALPGRRAVSSDAAEPGAAAPAARDAHLADAAQQARTQAQFAHRPRKQIHGKDGEASAMGADDTVDAITGAARYVPPEQAEASGDAGAAGAPLARAATHRDIPGNVTQTSGVGPGQPNVERDVRAVQQRLTELGHYSGPVDGAFSADTETALRAFQTANQPAISTVIADNRDARFRTTGYGAHTGLRSTRGVMRRNDATAQVLHQAFPRVVGGHLRTEAQAHTYYAEQVRAQGLPMEASETHIIGLRGYQAGGAHQNPGVADRTGAFNDTMVVLSTDAEGTPHVREFRATLDPGNNPDNDRRRLRQLGANQQIQYRLSSTQHERGGNRPVLFMQTGQGVVRPGQSRGADNLSTDEHATNVVNGENADGQGTLMMHSGGGVGDQVRLSSLGCQVPHADWYPSFYRAVEGAAETPRSRVPYTILEGAELSADAP